jgi:hypothetical protein
LHSEVLRYPITWTLTAKKDSFNYSIASMAARRSLA